MGNNPKTKLGINLTSQMVHYLIVKMISQIVQYFSRQKDHPNHVGQVQINLSRLKGWFF